MVRDDCVFCQVMAGKLPSDIEFENENLAVFRDINPQAPVHLLIVPKKHIARLSDTSDDDSQLLCEMLHTAKDMADKLGLKEKGFRLVLNDGKDSGQSIFHIHLHLLSGRRLMWPPG
ncbi:MAG: HIT domain-containing protein [Caldithrix sp.]|nr:HIT domain-containing protein [Caldithrix sp.]